MLDIQDTNLHKDFSANVHSTELGDGDTHTIEMDFYDSFWKEDGEIHSNAYLLKCRDKLRRKYQHASNELH